MRPWHGVTTASRRAAAIAAAVVLAVFSVAGVALAVTHDGDRGDGHAGAATLHAAAAAAARQPGAQVVDVRPRAAEKPPVSARPVAPLKALYTPDVLVDLPTTATSAQVARLRATPGVLAVTVMDAGQVRTPYATLYAVGVDPSTFRTFTPKITAVSDPLWQAIARGDVAVSYSNAERLRPRFGLPLTAASGHQRTVRLGAFASFAIPGADMVVSHEVATWLGMLPARKMLVAAPRLSLAEIRDAVQAVTGPATRVRLLRPEAVDQSLISAYAADVIPASYLRLYRAAATTCPGLPWSVLAAIGAVETGHGSDVSTSYAGAMGPMQFLPSTWRVYGRDADGDGKADIMDPVDAIYSAAYYLCDNGAGRGGQALYDAIFAYNHADWYVREVIALALRYQ